MSGLFIHAEPHYGYRMWAPAGDAATWDIADPVQISTNQLEDCADTQVEIPIIAIVGFACEPAEGIHAASRTTSAADGFGAVENQMRSYWPFDAPGLLLRTRNFWDAGDVVTPAEKEGADLYDLVNMKGATGLNIWGLEDEAPTGGTDAEFQIVAICREDMSFINADATVAAGTAPPLGEGWIIFRPVRGLLSQLTEGGA